MRAHIVLFVAIASYISCSTIFLLVIRRIRRNPDFIDAPPTDEKYRKSIWFWPDSDSSPKGSAPDLATPTAIVRTVVLLAWFALSREACHYWLGHSYGSIPFSAYNGFGAIVMLIEFVLAEVLSECWALLSRGPMSIAYSKLLIRNRKKSKVVSKYTVVALSLFVFLYPVRIMGLLNYGTVGQEQLVYSSPFSLKVRSFPYATSLVIQEEGAYVLYNADGDKVVLDNMTTGILDDNPITSDVIEACQAVHG